MHKLYFIAVRKTSLFGYLQVAGRGRRWNNLVIHVTLLALSSCNNREKQLAFLTFRTYYLSERKKQRGEKI